MVGTANEAQATHWNDRAGRTWVDLQPLIDRMFAGLLPHLIEPIDPNTRSILDVGCGAGALTLAAAERAGPDARALGVDISAPLVAAAEARAAGRSGVTFRVADAQTAAFEPGGFDAVLSRFGVMFFDDPVAAFANLHRATRRGGLLRFAAWRAPQDNPFMRVPKRAVGHLVDFPPFEPDAPGQFGFADRDRVLGILAEAGWRDARLESLDVPCRIAAEDVLTYGTRMGPLGGMWDGFDAPLRAEIARLLREAFREFEHDGEVRFTAGCWLAQAAA